MMTTEQKLEYIKNLGNEELVDQYMRAVQWLPNELESTLDKETINSLIENERLCREEIIRRMVD